MTWKRLWLLLAFAMVWHARDVGAQPAGRDPILRLNAGGPTGYVSGLALTDDGRTLYSVGFDQVVRVWSRNADGGYSLDPFAFRVPVGPGLRGALNTVAVSSDGRWLAAAGHGVVDTGFRQIGFVVPAVGMPPERYRDMGVIHVWDTRARTVRVLRGHTGPVFSLSFGPARGDKAPLLASGAQDYDLKSFQEQGAIKLWDPSAEVPEIASHDMPKLSHPRLNVAITETGADPKQTKVASAWGDGKTRIWDVAADKVSSFADGTVNIPLVRFPDRPKFLTAGVQGGQGSLRVWDAAPTESPAELAIYPVNHVPRALAIISSVPGGKPDHLATVLEGPARNDGTIPYQLQLTQLAGATPVRTVELWAGRRNWPAVVAAPQGQWLAVAGNDAHEIQMFNIKELLAGNAKPVSLRSVGAVYRHVAFVQSKDGMGLALSEAPKERPGAPARPPREGDHVLHLTKRQLSDDLAPWKLSTPDAGDWSTAITNPRPNEWAVSVREKGKERSLITLRRGQRVTEVALLPPGKWHKNPIVAVASETFLLPFLALYDGVTGDQFRLCTAHTDPIRALAFSPDGRLLASAAEDQTVCVWSLTNLEMILDKRGLLRGMPVKEDTGRLLLAKPDEERILAANQKALTDKAIVENDEIEGLVVGGELRRLQRVAAFYDAISRFAPGDKVTLRFRVRGDVALVVGQAIDERNPLFSLFVTREGRAERREWIGWSPNGPYEYSNRRAERWIGWHFNPVRLDTGATFDSPADQYHKEFFREGLLRHLVAQGAIAPALREWEKEDRARPLPQPVMRPWIDKTGPNTERAGAAVLVRDLPKTLRVLIGNFPPEKVGSLEWQVDNGPRRAFPPGDQAERTADVSGHAWKRGAAVIRVFLRTAHEEPREHVVELPIRYHPSPPILPAIAPADRRRVTDQDSFTLPLKLQPGDGRRPATVRFRVIRDGNEVAGAAKPAELALNEPSDVKPVFGLKPGPNRIEVVASNADAAVADLELLVEYQPKPVPRIDLESVVPLLDNDNTPGEPIVIGAASRVVVASSTVRVVGRVKASEAIADVRWVAGEGEGRRIAGFADGKPEQAINQTIVLKPGPTAIRITSRGASGGETTATIVIDYRPETPRAEITLPARGQLFFAGESNAETEVRGRVFPRDDAEPFETSVQVNDKSFPVKVDAATQEFVVTVPLVPGHNRISAKTTNKWGASRIGEPIEARYLRPPLVSPIAIPATSERPMVTLNAAVKSDLPLV
jgi:WD40 repeat protein